MRRVGEPHRAAGVDDQIVRRQERAVVGRRLDDVAHGAVGAHALEADFDFVVVGSGGGSMCAGLVMRKAGK